MKASTALILAVVLCSCSAERPRAPFETVRLDRARNDALSRPATGGIDALAGAMLLRDGPAVRQPELAIARAILRTNPRIQQAYALLLAVATADSARDNGLPPEFLAATLLQESAYEDDALSSAGAIGIAQFMPETAEGLGIDPFDPFAAIAAAGSLLGGYVRAYGGRYDDAYAAALAAYNAGPEAVRRYGGVPPYPETRDYIALIFDRSARIAGYEPPAH